ncbi:MAG TPA: glycosyltransferase family 39 protein [Pirellulales bacterium]|nr:glycosyltransferase family 39 protein [Pirellulales bacterium]
MDERALATIRPGNLRRPSEAVAADAGNTLCSERRIPACWREWQFWAVVAVVGVIYCARLTALPVCGEESRWATVAREMIDNGDWIVPRQQGHVFAERPPLGSWAMAAVGVVRGEVDLFSIRLPSALATTLVAALIYAYARIFLTRLGALAAALAYGTAGQVLQIGRLGESEAIFTLLLSASLLVWHAGYTLGWPRVAVWCAGYGLAGLAALVKGPQAPVYFVAVTVVFLAWQRQWKWLFAWQHLAGVATLIGVIAAWQIPFWVATDQRTVIDVWSKLARERFSFAGLASHTLSFPLETFACLLPWSFFLTGYLDPRFCRQLRALGVYRPLFVFIGVTLAVTYPSVWLSAGARGRYYMPLYPCLAVLVGVVIERAAAADASYELRRGWRWFCWGIATAMLTGGVVLVVAALNVHALQPLAETWTYTVSFVLLAAALAWWLFTGRSAASPPGIERAVLACSMMVGLAFDGAAITARAHGMHDIGGDVAALRDELPAPGQLISFGPVAHRFAYCYGLPIAEMPWPSKAAEVPAEVEYFCFEHHPGDNAEVRQNGRGSFWGTTSGKLPFEWVEVAAIPYTPYRNQDAAKSVIVGRIVRHPSAETAGKPSVER